MQPLTLFTFHSNTTTASDGNIYKVINGDFMMLEFVCTGAFSAEIRGHIGSNSNTFYPIGDSYNKSTLSTDYKVKNDKDLFQVPLGGLSEIQIKVISTTAPLTVYGRVMG